MTRWACVTQGPLQGKIVEITRNGTPEHPCWKLAGVTDPGIEGYLKAYREQGAAVIDRIMVSPPGAKLGSLLVLQFAEHAKSWGAATVHVYTPAMTRGAVRMYRNIHLLPNMTDLAKRTSGEPWQSRKIGPNFSTAVWKRSQLDGLLQEIGNGVRPLERALEDGYDDWHSGGAPSPEETAVTDARKVAHDTGLYSSLTQWDWIDPKKPIEERVKRLALAYKAALLTSLTGSTDDVLSAARTAIADQWKSADGFVHLQEQRLSTGSGVSCRSADSRVSKRNDGTAE